MWSGGASSRRATVTRSRWPVASSAASWSMGSWPSPSPPVAGGVTTHRPRRRPSRWCWRPRSIRSGIRWRRSGSRPWCRPGRPTWHRRARAPAARTPAAVPRIAPPSRPRAAPPLRAVTRARSSGSWAGSWAGMVGAARTSASWFVSRARAPTSRACTTSGVRPRMRAAASGANPSRSTRTTATRSAGARAASASTTCARRPPVVAGMSPLPPAGSGCTGGSAAATAASTASAASATSRRCRWCGTDAGALAAEPVDAGVVDQAVEPGRGILAGSMRTTSRHART